MDVRTKSTLRKMCLEHRRLFTSEKISMHGRASSTPGHPRDLKKAKKNQLLTGKQQRCSDAGGAGDALILPASTTHVAPSSLIAT